MYLLWSYIVFLPVLVAVCSTAQDDENQHTNDNTEGDQHLCVCKYEHIIRSRSRLYYLPMYTTDIWILLTYGYYFKVETTNRSTPLTHIYYWYINTTDIGILLTDGFYTLVLISRYSQRSLNWRSSNAIYLGWNYKCRSILATVSDWNWRLLADMPPSSLSGL